MRAAPAVTTESYRHCRNLAASHGRTYFLATRLLAREHRPAIHALYGFARATDDIVDTGTMDDAGAAPDAVRDAALDAIERALRDEWSGSGSPGSLVDGPASTLGPVLPAFFDTVAAYGIEHDYFFAFLESMRMDVPGSRLHRRAYRTMAELDEYMYGSAAVIGLQVLPVLGADTATRPYAAALGEAFQLTNFVRDVGEDLDRGRLYLPADELAAFGVDEELLRRCRRDGHDDPRVRRALAHVVAHTRARYRAAEPGLTMLGRRAGATVTAAFTLYGEILDRIEAEDFAVLHRRAVVPRSRRLAVAARELAKMTAPRAC
ncbi:phytoene/squalene synthase family protein [Rhodococcus rhodnii]|uniref:Phytoene/squalene synthase family protein n=1 Tax=Rhodococcus rhodnii TaxID=38312 RepID=A0A6P2CIW1_9NOCA|nr:phytoene/squalene synthase family protein [Rhodococcus rhodnii]TXG92767.1 phytoene/squalene synthase family protein [Rhodococcus rhodnii]